MNKEQPISFFDTQEENETMSLTDKQILSNSLKVFKLTYVDTLYSNWRELFKGYDKLYAVTYSSSIDFISKLIPMFKEVEIIFGFEKVLRGIDDIMAYQQATLDELRTVFSKKNQTLLDKIDDKTLKLYLMRDKTSHKKMYILESENLPPKVITGSANLSNIAFSGRQLENIYVVDGIDAYFAFMNDYNELKGSSVDTISKKAILLSEKDEIENLPIVDTIKTEKVVVVEEQKIPDTSDVFLIKHDHIKAKYKETVPKNSKGKILLSAQNIITMKKKYADIKIAKRNKERITPKLLVDIHEKKITFNDKIVDLKPKSEEIRKDIELFIDYMNGFNIFLGDVKDTIDKYYAFAVWLFVSPFMSIARRYAILNNKQSTPYPLFGLLYGESNAGKTKFLETITKMMIGLKTNLPAHEFVKTTMFGLRQEMKGSPIIVDDLKNDRFRNHAIELIKDDYLSEENISCIAISANKDVKVVQPELSKRMIMCKISSTLPKLEGMKSSLVRKTQNNIGTAFYREFLRRMMISFDEFIDTLSSDVKDAPDIFKLSSINIKNIIEEFYNEEVPSWVKTLDLEYYFVELVEQGIKNKLINMWQTNPNIFKIDKRKNLLVIDTEFYHEANSIATELPPYIQIGTAGSKISLYLNKTEEYLNISFKKTILNKLLK